jgi:hypothetical protein
MHSSKRILIVFVISVLIVASLAFCARVIESAASRSSPVSTGEPVDLSAARAPSAPSLSEWAPSQCDLFVYENVPQVEFGQALIFPYPEGYSVGCGASLRFTATDEYIYYDFLTREDDANRCGTFGIGICKNGWAVVNMNPRFSDPNNVYVQPIEAGFAPIDEVRLSFLPGALPTDAPTITPGPSPTPGPTSTHKNAYLPFAYKNAAGFATAPPPTPTDAPTPSP